MSRKLTEKQIKRKKERRSAKEARKAQYAAWAAAGQNRKSPRATKRAAIQRRSRTRHNHATGPCGNIGCRRCSPNAPHPGHLDPWACLRSSFAPFPNSISGREALYLSAGVVR